MARKSFKYYFFDENRKPLYFDKATGLVKTGNVGSLQKPNGQPIDLQDSPDGWKDTLLKYGRNNKYWGLFRDMTVPMNFHGDAYEILRKRMWDSNGGVAQTTHFGMQKLDRTSMPYTYKNWLLNELDFNKYKQNKTGAVIQSLEGGLSKYLKANDAQVYDIPIGTDNEVMQLVHDGIPLDNTATFMIMNDESFSDPTVVVKNHIVGVQMIQKEIGTLGDTQDAITRTKVKNSDVESTGLHIFEASVDGVIKVDFDFQLDVRLTPGNSLAPGQILRSILRRYDKNGSVYANDPNGLLIMLQKNGGSFPNQNIPGSYHVVGSANLNVKAGDTVYFYTFTDNEGATGDAILSFNYGGNLQLKLGYQSQFPTTTMVGLSPLTLAKRLLDKMTESTGVYTVQSNFLTSISQSTFITSGDALRRLNGASIHTSFSDFFKTFFCQYGIGLGIRGNTLVIELLSYFFQTDIQILDIGELTDWDIYVAEDLLYSSGKFGFENQDYEGLNGKYEFNNGQRWKFPVTSFTKEGDFVSPYRCDPIGIELYRTNLNGKTTTDDSSDNDTFMINVVKTVNTIQYKAVKNASETVAMPFNVKFDTVSDIFFEATDKSHFTFKGASPAFVNIGIFFQISKTDNSTCNVQILRNGNDVLSNKVVNAAGLADNISALGVTLNPNDVLTLTISQVAGDNNVTVLASSMIIFFPNAFIYELNRANNANVSGIAHPDGIYNTLYSPKSAMLRLGSYLHSILDRMDGGNITMTDADKNTDLVISGVKESDPLPVGNLPKKLFQPYYISGKTQVTVFYKEIMDTNPYGLIKFTINGNVFYGFMNDGGMKPATNDVQEWIMISAPDNDFSKIKRGQTL